MTPIYAIGDVHGCYEQAKNAVTKIQRYHAEQFSGDPRIIWLGDLTDRGPNSKEVVEFIMERGDECVMGNHDYALVASYISPNYLQNWLNWGAGTTLKSYGHDEDILKIVISALMGGVATKQMLDQIDVKLIPEEHVKWISSLPTKIETDNHFFCHAGVDPKKDFAEQDDYDLMWIRGEFLDHRAMYPKLVVHGHSIVNHSDRYSEPPNRVNLDFGAYHYGKLCVGVFDDSVPGGHLVEKFMIT